MGMKATSPVPLPDIPKVQVYRAALLARCTLLPQSANALNDAMGDLRADMESGPSGSAHLVSERSPCIYSRPFNTDCLPLSYSGNPGVN